MFKYRYLAAPVMLALVLAACSSTSPTPTPKASTAASDAAPRVVTMDIGAGFIDPASVTVQQGETVTFEATNVSDVVVELIVGTKTDVDADSGDSLKEAEDIAPGETATVTYTFDGAGPFAYGDQLEDHYAAGAKGDIVVQP